MTQAPSARRFDAVTITLHWATVILIVGMFASVWALSFATGGDQATGLLTLHRSLGLTVWAVVCCRLVWRVRFAILPPFPSAMSKLQQRAARLSEYALYALLLLQPLTGLVQSLTRGRPFHLFVFEAPKLMAKDKPLTALLNQIHGLTAWVLLGLIGLHVTAALFHRFVLHDEVLSSMLPWRPKRRSVAQEIAPPRE